jgi:glutathione S-transferase
MIRMFDLAAGDPAIRFSPYCWRTKLALAHKGLAVETIAWRFSEVALLPEGHRLVPTIIDGDKTLSDSFAIALYLEQSYPDRPSLFGGSGGEAHARLINAWADAVVQANMVRLIVHDIWSVLAPDDQTLFRKTREKRLGTSLEAAQEDREERVTLFRQSLQPARIALRTAPWLGGEAPSYADYILAGAFMWARSISHFETLAPDDTLHDWLGRVLALHGGLCEAAPRVSG